MSLQGTGRVIIKSGISASRSRCLATNRVSIPPQLILSGQSRQLHATHQRLAVASQKQVLGSTCPSCQASLASSSATTRLSPTCPSCSSLLPPPPPDMSCFKLFDVDPPTFRVDKADLKRRFLQLQQKCHPDLFSGQQDKEDWAKEWSARLNDAWKTLADDRSRGEYLVSTSWVNRGDGHSHQAD